MKAWLLPGCWLCRLRAVNPSMEPGDLHNEDSQDLRKASLNSSPIKDFCTKLNVVRAQLTVVNGAIFAGTGLRQS